MAEIASPAVAADMAAATPVLPSPTWTSPRRAARQAQQTVPAGLPTQADFGLPGSGARSPPAPREPVFLQPAEFYPLTNHTGKINLPPPRPDGLLSPEDDKLAMRGIPIFRPTIEDFADFEGYVTKTVPWGQYSGIVKIIPPAEWTQSLPSIPAQSLADVQIRSPIQQNMLGQAGLFRATNVEKNKNRPLSVKEWFEKSTSEKFRGPGPKDVDMTLDRDSQAVKTKRAEELLETKKRKAEMREKRKAALARKAERNAYKQAEEEDAMAAESNQNAGDELQDGIDGDDTPGPCSNRLAEPPVPPLDPSSHHSPQSSAEESAKTPESDQPTIPSPVVPKQSLGKTRDGQDAAEWYQEFTPSEAWLPKDTRPEDYTPEACANLERRFWKTMGLGEPGWYGADLQGTLFPDPETPWNVAHLPNLLNRLGRELPGVNRPYLYFGMWRATFAWHVEDMDLFSINYIHFGAPKFWYAIPQGQAEQFERTITSYFPREAAKCDQFLRHKAYVMSPTRLAKDGIHVNMLVHSQGEFVITYPRGYHAGWNMGFNCAESVNFALDSWVELGRRAKVCQCVSHSVRIDMDELLGESKAKREQEEKMKTELEIIEAIQAERVKGPKRPRPSQVDRPRKKPKTEGDETVASEAKSSETADVEAPALPIAGMAKKRKTIPLENKSPRKPAITRAQVSFPCVLCVNTSSVGLLDVFEPNKHVLSICKSADGKPRAHEACAKSLPETWVSELEGAVDLKPVVAGVNEITKARWALKCHSCTDKTLAGMGAKIQCVQAKCARAFHVTCARDDEQVVFRTWVVEERVSPPAGAEDSEATIEKVFRTECLCPTHNPNVKEAKKAKAARELKERVMAILPGQSIKVKSSRGAFEVALIRVIEGDQMAEVRYDDGQTSMVKWSDIDFRPAPVHHPIENEYAREYNTTRNEEGKIVHIPSSSSNLGPSRPPAITNRRQPLSINQMLNHSIPPRQAQPIPSRVVVCDSEYRPPIPTQYAEPPPSFLTRAPPMHAHPTSCGQYPQLPYMPPYGYPGPPATPQLMTYPNPGNTYAPYNQAYPSASIHSPYHVQPQPLHSSAYVYSPSASYQVPSPLAYPGPPALQPLVPSQMSQMPFHQSRPEHSSGLHLSHITTAPVRHPSAGDSTGSSRPSYFPSTPGLTGHLGLGQSNETRASSVASMSGSEYVPSNNANGINLGLERMRRLMLYLHPLCIPAIHLAGTNGKGSVSAFLESVLRKAGLRVARYNSPHLLEPRDAILLDGVPPSYTQYAATKKRITRIAEEQDIQASLFEIATTTAYDLIIQYRPDVMIIECGMGGCGDATNVIPPEYVLATALTSVGLDHTAFLGDTVEEITRVKAGIAVPGGLTVIGPQTYNGVARVAMRIAEGHGSRSFIVDRASVLEGAKTSLDLRFAETLPARYVRVPRTTSPKLDMNLSLAGDHQLDNVSVAVNILSALRADQRSTNLVPALRNLSDQIIAAGIGATQWKGRLAFHRLPTAGGGSIPVLVDGAHNADSATSLKKFIDDLEITPRKVITWVISLSDSKGKTPQSVLQPLLSEGDRVFVTGFRAVEGMPWVRPVASDVLSETVKDITGRDAMVRASMGDVFADLKRWKEEERGLVVVAGSLYGVADFYRLMNNLGA